MVECDLAKVEVAGSNPVSRSNLRSRLPIERELRLASPDTDDALFRPLALLLLRLARGRISLYKTSPAGAVAKW